MPSFQVDAEQIRESGTAVNASITSIRDAVAGMYTSIDVLQSVWSGPAASHFATVAQQWRAAQQQMERSLESIQQALDRASTVYADAEQQATQLFAIN